MRTRTIELGRSTVTVTCGDLPFTFIATTHPVNGPVVVSRIRAVSFRRAVCKALDIWDHIRREGGWQ